MVSAFRAVVERRVFSFTALQTFSGQNRAVCGPVPMGYVIVSVSVFGNHAQAADTIIGWALSSSRTASAAAFDNGQSLLDTGEKSFGTAITVMRLRLNRQTVMPSVVPFWVPVKTSGMVIHTEWETLGSGTEGFLSCFFTCERWEEVFSREEAAADGSG